MWQRVQILNTGEDMMGDLDTFPKIIRHNYEKYGHTKIAMRCKRFGIWKHITWADFYKSMNHLSLGLKQLGLEWGDKVFILGDNEPEWLYAAYAVQAAGGIFVGGYSDSTANELKYYIEDCDARLVFAEDQEQVDKLLFLKTQVPSLQKVIYWDPKGLWSYQDPLLMSMEEVEQIGRQYGEGHPGEFERILEQTRGDNVALIAYTSGTTGLPKGTMLTHQGLIEMARNLLQIDPIYETDELMSYIPLGWPGDFVCTIHRALIAGAIVNFAEAPDTVEADIREIGATEALLSPKLLEARMKEVETKISRATGVKRWYYHLLMPVGYKVASLKLTNMRVSLFWRVLYGVANCLLFRPLKDRLGYLKTRLIFSAGATIAPEAYSFYHAIGANLKCSYGISEGGGVITLHRDDIQKDSVGPLLPNIQARISDMGEVLLRTPGMFMGYYNNQQSYNKSVKDGWFYTGDYGYINDLGHLIIFDRMTDMITMADGTRCSPQYIESKLRVSPYIAEAMVVGHGQEYLSAIMVIDYNTVGRWAEEHGFSYTTYTDLSQKSEIYELLSQELKRFNREMTPGLRIRKFLVLHKQLDADDAELTRLRKLRRHYVEQHYTSEIEALYTNKSEVLAEATVVYRDGQTRNMIVRIKIETVEE